MLRFGTLFVSGNFVSLGNAFPGAFGLSGGCYMADSVEAFSQQKGIEDRIEKMFAGDKLVAGTLVVGLWLTVIFVMLAVRGFIADKNIEYLCWAGAGVLLLFNTASIIAMLKHYAADKAHIYGVDIRHLDAGH